MARVVRRCGFSVDGVALPASAAQTIWQAGPTTTPTTLPQGDQRVQLDPRGSRRLSSHSLLDVHISRSMAFGKLGRVELMLDVLNALNDTAEEAVVTDNLFSMNFGQPTVFVDSSRALVSARQSRAIAPTRPIRVIAASESTDCSPNSTCRAPSCRPRTDL